jgi:hypothetical protein
MFYIDGTKIQVGDVFTDGSAGREEVRLQNRAKVLYVDDYTLVWFPLNEFTIHNDLKTHRYTSNTWCLSAEPKKVDLSELTDDELIMCNSVNDYINK